jgi:DNA polymerase-3 subunit delta'
MRFSDIPGQESVKKELLSLYENDRIPHALLFSGPQGNGKLALAIAFASFLQCKGDKKEDKCEKCISCKKTDKFIHPDINFIFPTYGSKNNRKITSSMKISEWREILTQNIDFSLEEWNIFAGFEGKQPTIYTDTVIELQDYFVLKRFEGNKKISIIWQAELLGNEGNKILKLIEEPPPDSLLILVADNTNKILPTILSRCQIIRIPPYSKQDLLNWAANNEIINNDKLLELSNIAEGNIIEFNKLLNQNSTSYFDLFLNWLRLCYKGDSKELVNYTEQFSKTSKDNQKYFFKYGLRFLEKTLKSFYLDKEYITLTEEEYNSMLKIRNLLNFEKIMKMIDLFNKSIINIERNANLKVLIFNNSLKTHKILRN